MAPGGLDGSSEGFRPTLYIKLPEKTAPVPSGFYYVGGTVKTGFVISDDASDENKGVDYLCTGNQFVWVPVDDYSTFTTGTAEETFSGSGIYKMTGTLGSTSGSDAKYYSWSYGTSTPGANGTAINASEYQEMYASVKKYGGFYIARFEAGDSSATAIRTSQDGGTLVSKKDVYPYTLVGWSDILSTGSGASYALGTRDAVGLSKNMYKNHESVVSTLCYGVQWDATMNFVSDKDHNIADSTSWGNYHTGVIGDASLQKTGSNEEWKAKEIYDLAGNAGEWTLESVNGPGFTANGLAGAPVYRGGNYSSTSSSLKNAATRMNGDFGTAYREVAFRVALYLK